MVVSRLLDRGRDEAWFYLTVKTFDNRGNAVLEPSADPVGPVRVTVAEDRQSKAELPGQVDFRVMRMHLRPHLVNSSWGFVYCRGTFWEPANPEWNASGVTDKTRHQELLLREANQDRIAGLVVPGGDAGS